MDFPGWLLLLYALPSRNNSQRVSLWRKLKKFGALPLKTSAYLLPDAPAYYERFQWLAKQIGDDGGEATIVRAKEIEGLSARAIHSQFNEARAEDYTQLIQELTALLRVYRKKSADNFETAVERLRGRLVEIQQIDFFDSPRGQDAVMLFQKADKRRLKKPPKSPLLKRDDFQGKTWLTRPRPEIDRVGSAWLIKRFIDSRAHFVFAPKAEEKPEAVPYDMSDVELTHQGDDCTFETLVRRFNIQDKTVHKIAEIVHDTDLEDGKFQRTEGAGLHVMFQGWANLGFSDDDILKRGFDAFDAVYAHYKRKR